MARSRSRSPTWKQKPLSVAPRKPEYHRQRYSHGYYGSDYKMDPYRSTNWRMHKDGMSRQRVSSRERARYPFYQHRAPSPNMRSPLDTFYSHSYEPYQVYSPGREDGNSFQHMPKYSEDVYCQEYWQDYYPQQVREKYIPDDHRVRRSGRRGKSPQSSMEDSRFKGRWHEDVPRYQKIRGQKYSHSLRRGPEDFGKRSSFQNRYTEDHDWRRYGHTSKRYTRVKKYENREPSRNPQWQSKPPLPPDQEKKDKQDPKCQGHRRARNKSPETSSATKGSSDSRHKRRKTSDGDQVFSDGKNQKYSKEEDGKNTSPNRNRKSGCSTAGRGREAEGGKVKEPFKSSKKDRSASTHSNKSVVDLRASNGKQQKSKEEGYGKGKGNSPNNQPDESKPSDASVKKKSLVVKVDKKKTEKTSSVTSSKTERQMSEDLFAVGRKSKYLDPAPEHLDSAQNTENKNAEEFAQEIITVIHRAEDNFPSPRMTLHERFSNLYGQQGAGINEIKLSSAPGIHRRIHVSMAELQDRHIMIYDSEQTLVNVIDPNDLRHDIERRRKERLQNEDEHIFHIDSATERNDQPLNFSTHAGGLLNPKWAIKSNSRKFIPKTYKTSFKCGKLQSHYKSGLVQKSLYIQAKYQRLRFAGSKGFITNKFRERLLKKRKE